MCCLCSLLIYDPHIHLVYRPAVHVPRSCIYAGVLLTLLTICSCAWFVLVFCITYLADVCVALSILAITLISSHGCWEWTRYTHMIYIYPWLRLVLYLFLAYIGVHIPG